MSSLFCGHGRSSCLAAPADGPKLVGGGSRRFEGHELKTRRDFKRHVHHELKRRIVTPQDDLCTPLGEDQEAALLEGKWCKVIEKNVNPA